MLRDDINNAVKDAMKAKEERKLSTLRMVNSTIKNADIEARGDGKPPLSDEALLGVLQRMIKQRQEAAELYDKGGRAELAAAEREEIAIITAYLPKQMSEDDVKKAMSGLLAPTLRETMLGNAQILEIFNISKVGKIAGCRVTDGTVERGANVRLIRDNVVIHEGKLGQLKRFKDDAKEVVAGQECGMSFENYQDMRPGDIIECYRVETIQRSL